MMIISAQFAESGLIDLWQRADLDAAAVADPPPESL
jgi:hypothetical protein